jgi:hypothetical protein
MTKKFETPEVLKTETGKKENIPDLTPSPETVSGMEKKMERQKEIRKKEDTENFCSRMERFKEDYSSYEVKVGENTFTLKLEYLQKGGNPVNKEDYEGLKKGLQSKTVDLDEVGGRFNMESKDGLKLNYTLPAKLLLDPDGIADRLNNDFAGGFEKSRKEQVALPAPERKKEGNEAESSAEKENRGKQVEDARVAAQKAGGEASILSGEGLTSLIVNFPKGKQMVISSTTGALWSCEENEGGRKTSRGSRKTPIEFLLPSEKDPGS